MNIVQQVVENEIVDKRKAENIQPCKYFYKLFILRGQQEHINCHKNGKIIWKRL